ncbi:MAG: NADH:flavin oxidoreductase/NADH oxidase [Chloroflexi bacterium]|nr:NADH:flavin oxidoreductase/NADH oxidase [Chloroflexota bacterium]MDA1272100.1 NADH:flavin oxidoreductase/NADH oxidase [Chloroflexota bacterium]
MSKLFSPITIRGEEIPNRVFVAPMCQYSSETEDGRCSPWHSIHYGTRAVGGAGLVMLEASAIRPDGRITPWDLGMWDESHVAAAGPVADVITANGAVPAIQLAHAGRKASHHKPWEGGTQLTDGEGGWESVAPSPISFQEDWNVPRELTIEDISQLVDDFAESARLSVNAGMKVIELHMAHGYLGCEFLSPLSNHRTDRYGGSLENRTRFPLEATRAVRNAIPDSMPLFVRVSATEYMDNGWDVDECVEFSRSLKDVGVDLIDCSSGGNSSTQQLTPYPGYQVQFAARIKSEAEMATGAVGLITEPAQAEKILDNGEADVILLARELLRNPYWPIHAQTELDGSASWPSQYARVAELRKFAPPAR